jgi:hypothetical protein
LSDLPDDHAECGARPIGERNIISRDPAGFLTISIPWRPGLCGKEPDFLEDNIGDTLRQMRLVFHVGEAMLYEDDKQGIYKLCKEYGLVEQAADAIFAPHGIRNDNLTSSEVYERFGLGTRSKWREVKEEYAFIFDQMEKAGEVKSMPYFISTIDDITDFMQMGADLRLEDWVRHLELQ